MLNGYEYLLNLHSLLISECINLTTRSLCDLPDSNDWAWAFDDFVEPQTFSYFGKRRSLGDKDAWLADVNIMPTITGKPQNNRETFLSEEIF